MIYSPQDLLGTTESLLKYDEDERLSEASPQHLHNALGRAVMIAVGDNWAKSRARRAGKRKAYYLSAGIRRRLGKARRSLELPPREAHRPRPLRRPDGARRAVRYAGHRLSYRQRRNAPSLAVRGRAGARL